MFRGAKERARALTTAASTAPYHVVEVVVESGDVVLVMRVARVDHLQQSNLFETGVHALLVVLHQLINARAAGINESMEWVIIIKYKQA